MQTYVMMTRLEHNSERPPQMLEGLEHDVKDRIEGSLGKDHVEWVASYAVGGPYDYMDIFRTDDNEAAIKVATIVKSFGRAQSEVWPATEWGHFKDLARNLPAS